MKITNRCVLFVLVFLLTFLNVSFAAPGDVPGVSKSPSLYMPFENSNGVYGHGESDNPAWENVVNGEGATVFDRSLSDSTMAWPLTEIEYGVKGEFLDFTSMNPATGKSDILTFPAGSLTSSQLADPNTMTISMWIRTDGHGSDEYLIRGSFGGIKWRSDGIIFTIKWRSILEAGTAALEFSSQDEWLFLAMTYSHSGVKVYKGTPTEAPVLVADFVSDTGRWDTYGDTGIYISAWSYVNAPYPDTDVDELRIWYDTADQGELTLAEITSVWEYDYDPSNWCGDDTHPVPVGDVNGDCFVDIQDFAAMALDFLYSSAELEVTPVDILDRVYPDLAPQSFDFTEPYHVPRDSTVAFQFAATGPFNALCDVSVSDITAGSTTFTGDVATYRALPVYVETNSTECSSTQVSNPLNQDYAPYYSRIAPFYQAEALEETSQFRFDTGNNCIVVEIDVPFSASPGTYEGYVDLTTSTGTVSAPFTFTVHDTALGTKDYHLSHWLDPDPRNLGTETTYVQWWDEDHWALIEQAAKIQSNYFETSVMTPLAYGANPLIETTLTSGGTYSFDYTNFNRWVNLFLSYGYEYIEGAHLYRGVFYIDEAAGNTRKYKDFSTLPDQDWYDFLDVFFTDLYANLQTNGWVSIYKQHLIDETTPSVLQPFYNIAKNAMPLVETTDAVNSSSIPSFSGAIDYPCFALQNIPANLSDIQTTFGDNTLLYTYCQPVPDDGPNYHLDRPLAAGRVVPWFWEKYETKGMIRWAANKYRGADPYETSVGPLPNGSQTPGHPVGDNWLYYPGSEGLRGSMRSIAMRDGVIDYMLLEMLETQRAGSVDDVVNQVAPSLTGYEFSDNSQYHLLRKNILTELDAN